MPGEVAPGDRADDAVRADARMRLERDDGVADRSTEDSVDRQAEAALGVQFDLQRLHGRVVVTGPDGRHERTPGLRPDDPVSTETLGGLERLGGRHGAGAENAIGWDRLAVVLQQVLDRQYVGAAVAAALSREEGVRVRLRATGDAADQQHGGKQRKTCSLEGGHGCLHSGRARSVSK